MTEWKVGQKCAIVDTANVLARCPELVGSIGEIRALPKPPSKWIDVQVCDGRVLKLQPSALQSASNSRQTAAHFARDDDAESEDENDSAKMSHAQSLKRGTQVTIHRTENVQQRAPHLIGRVGIIKEVPQHPNTWFKVQFSDRRVCTFRPSALRRVDDDSGATAADQEAAAAAASSSLPPSAASATAKPTRSGKPGGKPGAAKRGGAQLEKEKDDDDDDDSSPRPSGAGSSAKDRAAKLLSSVDAEKWVGMFVRIRVGRLGGVIGRIMRSGNGWVQLRTLRGEVAKRAYELELVPDGEPLPELLEIDDEEEAPDVALPPLSSASTSTAASQAPAALQQTGAASAASSGGAGARMERPQRAAAVAAAAASAVPPSGSSSGNGNAKTSTRGASRRGRDDDSPTSVEDAFAGDSPAATAKGKAEAPAPSKAAKDKADAKSNIMSRGHSRAGSSSAKQSAYRDSVRKHLERQRDKFKDRPNLAEWLERLQGGRWNCDESAGGAYVQAYHVDDSDDEEEDTTNAPLVGPRWMRRARRRRADADVALGLPGCSFCRVEKIVGGSCWNEHCFASPVYVPRIKNTSVARRQCTLSETPRRCEIVEYITQAPEIRLTKDNFDDVAKPVDADDYLYIRADMSTFVPPKPPQSYLDIASKLEAEDAVKAKIAEENRQKELAEKKRLQDEADKAAAAASAAAAAAEEAAAAVAREAAAADAAKVKLEEEASKNHDDPVPVSKKRPLEEDVAAATIEAQPPTTVAKVGGEIAPPTVAYTSSSSSSLEHKIPESTRGDVLPAEAAEKESFSADADIDTSESKKRAREEAVDAPRAGNAAESGEMHEEKKQRHESWVAEASPSQVSDAEAFVAVEEKTTSGGDKAIFSGDEEDIEEGVVAEVPAVKSGAAAVDNAQAPTREDSTKENTAAPVGASVSSVDAAFVSMPPPGAREKLVEDDDEQRHRAADQAQARRLAEVAVPQGAASTSSSVGLPTATPATASAQLSPTARPTLPPAEPVVGESQSPQPRPFALPPLEDSQRQPHRGAHNRVPLSGAPPEADLHLHKPQFALPPSEEELRQRLGDAPLGRFAEHVWPPMPPKLASAHLSFPNPSPPPPAPEVALSPNATTTTTIPARFPPPAASEVIGDDNDKLPFTK